MVSPRGFSLLQTKRLRYTAHRLLCTYGRIISIPVNNIRRGLQFYGLQNLPTNTLFLRFVTSAEITRKTLFPESFRKIGTNVIWTVYLIVYGAMFSSWTRLHVNNFLYIISYIIIIIIYYFKKIFREFYSTFFFVLVSMFLHFYILHISKINDVQRLSFIDCYEKMKKFYGIPNWNHIEIDMLEVQL